MALKLGQIEDGLLDIWIGSDRSRISPVNNEILFFESSPGPHPVLSCSCFCASEPLALNLGREQHISFDLCFNRESQQQFQNHLFVPDIENNLTDALSLQLQPPSTNNDSPAAQVDLNSFFIVKWKDTPEASNSNVNESVEPEIHKFTSKAEHINELPEFKKIPIKIIKEDFRDGKPVKVWECSVCARQFQHQYTLDRHLPTHTDERKFVCADCGKAFRQLSTLNQHRVIHSTERPFTCEVCHKTFNRVSTLISHRKTHSEVKPFQCHICHKGFHQKGNLRNHINTHTNERPYRCSLCMKGFNQMSNLTCHKQKAHSDEIIEDWECYHCKKSFPKRAQLRIHELHHHQQDADITNNNISAEHLMANTRNLNPQLNARIASHHLQPALTPASAASSSSAPILTTGIVIPAIQTDAMKKVCDNNEVPFAVLHFLRCAPLLVRVVHYQNQSLLRPANKLDFAEVQSMAGPNKPSISVPIVAAVYQTLDHTGATSYTVMPPRNKFNTDLQKLTMYDQDTVFKMKASNPTPATKRRRIPTTKTKTITTNNSTKRADSEPQAKKPMKLPPIELPKKVSTLPKPLLMDSPNPVVVQPVQPIPPMLEQEDTDISEAILMFATGSFLSPRRKNAAAIKHDELSSPTSSTMTSSSYSADSEDVFGSSFANFVTALQSDGHTADLEKIKEFFCANGLINSEGDGESILP